MRKLLVPVLGAALAVLFCFVLADAQPIPGFSKTAPLSGTGSAGSPLKINSCATNEILKWNGSAWACAADGSGLSGLTNNRVLKANGTTSGQNSSLSDDGTTVSTVGTPNLQWGPTAPGAGQKWVFSGQQPTDTTMMYIRGDDTAHTVYEAIALWLDQRGTYNTTAQPSVSNGLTVTVSTTKSAGANTLTNVGIDCIVGGADANLCLRAQAGQGGISISDDSFFGKTTHNQVFTSSSFVQDIRGSNGSTINFSGASSPIVTGGTVTGSTLLSTGNVKLAGNTLWFSDNAQSQLYIYADGAGTSGNQSIAIQSAGTGKVTINANTGGSTNTGTGGFEVYGGNNDSTSNFTVAGNGSTTINPTSGVTSGLTITPSGTSLTSDAEYLTLNHTTGTWNVASAARKATGIRGSITSACVSNCTPNGMTGVGVFGGANITGYAANIGIGVYGTTAPASPTFPAAGPYAIYGDGNIGTNGSLRANTVQVEGGELRDTGTAPSSFTCGTGATAAGGRNWFRVTVGTGSPTTCVVNFSAAYTSTPTCSITRGDSSSRADAYLSAISTSSLTIANDAAAGLTSGSIYHVWCGG